MENIMNFEKYLNFLNESSGSSVFQKFLNNLERGGSRIQFSGTGEMDTTGATVSLIGKLLTGISKVGKSIASDFGMDWVEDKKNYGYYSKNRKTYLDRWAKENLEKNKKYRDDEIEKVYKDFREKGKKRFGKEYNFANPGKYATNDEKMWADYANGILKKYVDTRS